MIPERLEEEKEDHDGIKKMSRALATPITEGKEHIKEQNEMLKDVHNDTKFVCEHIQTTCKEKQQTLGVIVHLIYIF